MGAYSRGGGLFTKMIFLGGGLFEGGSLIEDLRSSKSVHSDRQRGAGGAGGL